MSILSFSIPLIILSILLLGLIKKVNIIEEFAKGVQDGLQSVLGVAPMLLLMLTALAMFRGSGAVEGLSQLMAPLCAGIGIPPELIPLAVLRPVSGSGSIAQLAEYLSVYGADSTVGRMASVLAASSETTFYTYALYSGAAGVQKLPHALTCGLIADMCAFLFSVLSVRLFLG